MKALLLLLLLSGCATRYLSEEEDQKFRETCEGQKCYVFTEDALKELLKRMGIGI